MDDLVVTMNDDLIGYVCTCNEMMILLLNMTTDYYYYYYHADEISPTYANLRF